MYILKHSPKVSSAKNVAGQFIGLTGGTIKVLKKSCLNPKANCCPKTYSNLRPNKNRLTIALFSARPNMRKLSRCRQLRSDPQQATLDNPVMWIRLHADAKRRRMTNLNSNPLQLWHHLTVHKLNFLLFSGMMNKNHLAIMNFSKMLEETSSWSKYTCIYHVHCPLKDKIDN